MNVPISPADIVVIILILCLMGYGVKLVIGFFQEGKRAIEESTYSGTGKVKIILQVDGMMCGQCESHVNEAIRKNFDVTKVTSSHKKGITTIIANKDIDDQKILDAIQPTGYRILSISKQNF